MPADRDSLERVIEFNRQKPKTPKRKEPRMTKSSRKVAPKVKAGGTAAALVTVIVFAVGEFGVTVPATVAAAGATVVSAAAAYMVPNSYGKG